MYFTCEYQDNKVEVNDPDVRLRQVITGEGEVIKNIDNKSRFFPTLRLSEEEIINCKKMIFTINID